MYSSKSSVELTTLYYFLMPFPALTAWLTTSLLPRTNTIRTLCSRYAKTNVLCRTFVIGDHNNLGLTHSLVTWYMRQYSMLIVIVANFFNLITTALTLHFCYFCCLQPITTKRFVYIWQNVTSFKFTMVFMIIEMYSFKSGWKVQSKPSSQSI